MQGLISGIKRNAVHDGDGLRTTVFFKGCPLKCLWCHNPESISFQKELGFYKDKCVGCGSCAAICPENAIEMQDGYPKLDRARCTGCGACADGCPANARIAYGELWEVEPLAEKLLRDKPFFDQSGGGVTLSGGECLAQPAFAIALAKRLWEKGISVNIDTCGAVRRQVLEEILPFTDTFLYDIKSMDSQVHQRCTGRNNGNILENLRFLCASGARVEILYPFVPGYNDHQCHEIGAFLEGLPGITKVKVLGYHSFADGKYAALNLPDTLPAVTVTAADVQKAVEILRGYGLQAVNGMEED